MTVFLQESEHYHVRKVRIEVDSDANIHDMLDGFETWLLAVGYQPETVKQGFIQKGQDVEGQHS